MSLPQLPKDLLCFILSKLKNWELWSFYTSCKHFYLLTRQVDFWKCLSNIKFNQIYDRKEYFKRSLQLRLSNYNKSGIDLNKMESEDFDLFMYVVLQYNQIPYYSKKEDVNKLPIYLSKEKLSKIYLNTHIATLINFKLDNFSIIQQQLTNKYHSNSALAKIIELAYKNNSMTLISYIIIKFKCSSLFNFLILEANKDSSLLQLVLKYRDEIMDIISLLKDYYPVLQPEIIRFLWQYKKEQVLKFIHLSFTWRPRTIIKIYRILGINNEIRMLYLNHFLSLSSKYLSGEVQLVKYCEEVLSEID